MSVVLIQSSVHVLLFLHLYVFFLAISLSLVGHSPLVSLDVGDHIHIGAIHIFQCPLIGVDSHAHGFVDSSNFNSVTWSHFVNEVFIGAQMDGLGCFTLCHRLRGLLNFDMLLV